MLSKRRRGGVSWERALRGMENPPILPHDRTIEIEEPYRKPDCSLGQLPLGSIFRFGAADYQVIWEHPQRACMVGRNIRTGKDLKLPLNCGVYLS